METLFLIMSSSIVGAWIVVSTFAMEFVHHF
jgi:hypothetical protein